MLDKVKLSLRLSHNSLDEDIQQNIDACLLDLKRVGVAQCRLLDADELICSAVILYCKWMYDFGGKGEQFRAKYEDLRKTLPLSEQYKEE